MRVNVSCQNYMKERLITPADDLKDMPWSNITSDHAKRVSSYDVGDGGAPIRIGTWNTLNPAYQNWLKPRMFKDEPGVDLSQRLWHIFDPAKNDVYTRIGMIAAEVCQLVEQGFVMCLQEVGQSLIDAIKAKATGFGGLANNIGMMRSRLEDEARDQINCNLVVFDLRVYEEEGRHLIEIPNVDHPEDKLAIIALRRRMDNPTEPGVKPVIFLVVNAHISWKKNKQYSDLFKNTFGKDKHYPQLTFIAGDFNCSSRTDIQVSVERFADFYVDDDIKVLDCGMGHGEYFSHVNTFENAGSTYNQIDCFDYILVVNSKQVHGDNQ
jgi:hypothetical protein